MRQLSKAVPVHDPGHSAGPSSTDAFEAVTRVIAWYTRQILAEQRSPAPDRQRLTQLQEQQRACVDDRKQLASAGPQEIARLVAHYEARLRELGGA
ncbi:hypothetical protein [Streptomyces triculaminicus]|uniref:hypothetical protein n=1 Tax=Streptomyces triculaminicus TaxID=2816232 RepID=UPI0037D96BED